MVYAINAGGPAVTFNSVDYKADNFSTGGTESSTTDPITGASQGALYQTERYGSFKYEIPVTNSTYSVKLHFAELFQTTRAARIFSVTVEGQPVVQNIDLFDQVGAKTAYDVIANGIKVSDEKLTIELTATVDNATIGGFAIYSNAGGKFVAPTVPVDPGGTNCDVPNTLRWTSSASPVINPRNGDASVKDPSIVFYNNKYHVFATVYNNGYKSMYTSFTDFNQAASGTYSSFAPGGSSTVAPQVFYFAPQNKWYIFTQWPAKYTTSNSVESGWGAPKTLWPGNDQYGGALDYWVICDDANCYLYFFKDDGKMYYVSTTIANFPNFNVSQVKTANVQGAGGQSILFEAGNVYKIKGFNKYLLLVEGWGASEGRRLFRSWTSSSLDGPWVPHKTSENDPFAGLNNVTFPGTAWSGQISHGEMIRSGHDQKMEIDACKMQFLYQGANLNGYNGTYDARPYKLGLLKAN